MQETFYLGGEIQVECLLYQRQPCAIAIFIEVWSIQLEGRVVDWLHPHDGHVLELFCLKMSFILLKFDFQI